ncbi:YitT family protein [Deefgea chitinilytica]|uniref:YitT family protein n=2 Tax=Chitinibacteraceae TaxID=2897177 RepID=A0ABS2CB67_9NEIS|nr:YitT family protein [Deefgea chitinilytica]MBM9888622.1 YitT family protein [Deefgea sp. CFH1-16]
MLSGVILVALGLQFFKHANLLTGGATGLAFVVFYLGQLPYGLILFVLNLPFYVFAYRVMGKEFTLKTFACVASLAIITEWMPQLIRLQDVNPIFAGLMGGLLAGVGILMLIRHKASLGGVTVLALYLQKTKGWRAGHVQLIVDLAILAVGMLIVSWQQLAISIFSAFILNMVIATNHKTGRYMGM